MKFAELLDTWIDTVKEEDYDKYLDLQFEGLFDFASWLDSVLETMLKINDKKVEK